jgi:hypothetical protein
MGERKPVWLSLRIISSILGALGGAFSIVILVDYADVVIFGDKSNVFLAALVGVPLGSSVGHTLCYWRRWRIVAQISMVAVCSTISFLFSYAFLYIGLTISEKYVPMLFILQFGGVIAITATIGILMDKSSLTRAST